MNIGSVTLGDLAQWVTLLGGVWLFFRKQAQVDATRVAKWEEFQKSVMSRIESIESLVYSRGNAELITKDTLAQDLEECGKLHSSSLDSHKIEVDRRITALEELSKNISVKLNEMDQIRERTRELDQQRLASIEVSLSKLTSDVGHLASDMQSIAQLGKTLETIALRLEGGLR